MQIVHPFICTEEAKLESESAESVCIVTEIVTAEAVIYDVGLKIKCLFI